ncbi:MAG: hypothetical protein FJ147_08255 [Deltaproteobacteria bacterium]|nr:hypothetical protein [Deltaproteobacteria bacterium]
MAANTTSTPPPSPLPLPELIGRVAVLGGSASDKSTLVVGLAHRQTRQQGIVLCLDARHHQQVELQLRLLLRQQTHYRYVRVSREVPEEVARDVLSVVGNSLSQHTLLPPLLLCDCLAESLDWERTIQFLLKANATIVEVLTTPTALTFGRYDTVLLLPESEHAAETLSRAVGRKVSGTDITQLKSGEGWLVHLTQVYRVRLPHIEDYKGHT